MAMALRLSVTVCHVSQVYSAFILSSQVKSSHLDGKNEFKSSFIGDWSRLSEVAEPVRLRA